MPISQERLGPVLVARIGNPPTDLLDAGVLAALDRLTRDLQSDRDIGALVVTGPRPGVFVPHFDLAAIQEGAEALGMRTPYPVARAGLGVVAAVRRFPGGAGIVRRSPAAGLLTLLETQDTLARLGRLPQVVIAAIDGDALGGGCELALACDVRIMADADYRIGLPELSAGIPPGAGGTQRLAQVLGPGRALSMILRAHTVGPQEALRLGLVDSLAPGGDVVAAALAVADSVARWNPAAVVAAKRAVRGAAEELQAGGYRREAAGFVAAASGPRAIAALRAFTADSITAAGITPWRDRTGLP